MEVRINKYLSESGFCSRRAADKLIEEGRVTIDGNVALMGSKVSEGNIVLVDGKSVTANKADKKVVIAFNKPVGIVCTAEKREKNNVIDYIKYPTRIYPIGRLDKDSEGLLLLTNDGELMNKILKASLGHEKEYVVRVDKEITDDFLDKMSKGGIPILDKKTAPCKVTKMNSNLFNIVLTQGMNRQIRRMCQYLGFNVRKLKRIRIMNVMLDGIKLGTYRELTPSEYEELYKAAGLKYENN